MGKRNFLELIMYIFQMYINIKFGVLKHNNISIKYRISNTKYQISKQADIGIKYQRWRQ